ncbi:hypothetical protein [Cryptosporangium minutisporangium]|uniref:hypothetical protein n=1 Tax=Cryptosporangium minutisporangium TaxID=113569 RepID=UPI0031EB6EE0
MNRWLAGMRPRGRTGQYIADAIGERLGRTVTLADVGMSATEALDPELGMTYGTEPEDVGAVLSRLWRADLDDMRPILDAPPKASAWAEASLAWLVRPGRDDLVERAAGVRVGQSDVDAVRATTAALDRLDNDYGGERPRRALIQFLHSDVAGLLAGRYGEQAGRQLHAAAAEATLLAAWATYDAGVHGMAQRYFIQSLRLAQAADDVLLASSALDAMSHQATFLGRSREAANLARAARTGSQRYATPTLTAHFYAMEARALAVGGDVVGTQKALGEAVNVFERRQPGNDPDWISYVDDAELAAELAHSFRDIGRSADAVTYAVSALAGSGGASARSDFFVTMVQAAGHLGQGDVEQACVTARAALDLGEQVRSARCVEYLRQFRKQLAPHAASAHVRELVGAAGEHHLWVASRTARGS